MCSLIHAFIHCFVFLTDFPLHHLFCRSLSLSVSASLCTFRSPCSVFCSCFALGGICWIWLVSFLFVWNKTYHPCVLYSWRRYNIFSECKNTRTCVREHRQKTEQHFCCRLLSPPFLRIPNFEREKKIHTKMQVIRKNDAAY